MKTIREASIFEIEHHLVDLGSGNHVDNMEQVSEAPRHLLVELSEEDFRSLIFVESEEVASIMPLGRDRRLEMVVARAIGLPKEHRALSENWNIDHIEQATNKWLTERNSSQLPTLLLRDLRDGEKQWAQNGWYLQDGAHRSLGFLMAVMRGLTNYEPQQAYCATCPS